MKTEKRMICFIVSAALLIVMLWFTSCSSTSANGIMGYRTAEDVLKMMKEGDQCT